jgi:hypothetical protein
MSKQPYLVFEASYETRAERWYVTESKANAIYYVTYGANNALPISTEMYNEYKKLEEEIYALKEKLYKLQEPFEDAMFDDESFFNDPEYQEAYKFNEMWREAHAMNRLFDYKKKWGTSVVEQEEVEPLAEWEKELLAALPNKEETNE